MGRHAAKSVFVTIGAFLIPAVLLTLVSLGYAGVVQIINPYLKQEIPSEIQIGWGTFLMFGFVFQVWGSSLALDKIWNDANCVPPTGKDIVKSVVRMVISALFGTALFVIIISLYAFAAKELTALAPENFPNNELLFFVLQAVCYIWGTYSLMKKTQLQADDTVSI